MKNNLMTRKNINVDKANNIPVTSFKQEDNGVLKLALFANSVMLDCTGQTIRLDVKRPDYKLVTIESGITIANKNEIDIQMTTNCFIASGLLECDLVLTDASGKMTTASFFITVGKKVTGSENVQGANVIGAIDACVKEYETWKDAVAEGKGAFINDKAAATTTVYSSTKTQAEFDKVNSSLDNKANKNEVFSMANMGQDVKEAMTGGSVAVVGKNAVLNDNILDKQISVEKLNFIDFYKQEIGNKIDSSLYISKTFSQVNSDGGIKLSNITQNSYYLIYESDNGDVTSANSVLWYFVDANGNKISNYCRTILYTNALDTGKVWEDVKGIKFFTYSGYGTYIIKNVRFVTRFDKDLNTLDKKNIIQDDFTNFKSVLKNSYNLFSPHKVRYGATISASTGKITLGGENDFISEFIDCQNYDIVYLRGLKTNVYLNWFKNDKQSNTFADYNSIKGYAKPVDYRYLVISGTKDIINNIIVSFDEKAISEPYSPDKIIRKECVEGYSNITNNHYANVIGDSLGDSITGLNFFQSHTKKYFSMKSFYNHGIGGTKLTGIANSFGDSMWYSSRINSLNENADFVTVMGGTNDGNVNIGDISTTNFDTNTYVGALNVVISKIYYKYLQLENGYYSEIDYSGIVKAKNKKNVKIIIMTPTWVQSEKWSNRYMNQSNACREVARLWSLNCVDFAKNAGVNEINDKDCFTSDTVHPNEFAFKTYFTPVLISELERIKFINFDTLK